MQFLFYLNPKFQASSHLLWLHSPVCVGPGLKPRRPVFSQRGSCIITLKFKQGRIESKGADGIANIVDTDQTASLTKNVCYKPIIGLEFKETGIYTPCNCVCGWVYCFHVRPSDRPTVCVSITFCFLNILKNH